MDKFFYVKLFEIKIFFYVSFWESLVSFKVMVFSNDLFVWFIIGIYSNSRLLFYSVFNLNSSYFIDNYSNSCSCSILLLNSYFFSESLISFNMFSVRILLF
jgi:hypothetical protein